MSGDLLQAEFHESLEGWVELDSLFSGMSLPNQMREATAQGVPSVRWVNMKPYILKVYEERILAKRMLANDR